MGLRPPLYQLPFRSRRGIRSDLCDAVHFRGHSPPQVGFRQLRVTTGCGDAGFVLADPVEGVHGSDCCFLVAVDTAH